MNTTKTEIPVETVRGLINGDQKAFKHLFDMMCKNLVYFSYNMVKDQEIAENIVQDSFLAVWENRKNIDYSRNFKTYLYTIVRNRSLKHLRHLEVQLKNEADIQLIYSKSLQPDQIIDGKELKENYKKAIAGLPEKCRVIFLMSRDDKLTYSEISEILDISVKTVETQMSRALKSLREYLSYLLTILLFFCRGI